MAVIGYCGGCRRSTYVGERDERTCPVCGRQLEATNLEPGRARVIAANESHFRELNEATTSPTAANESQSVVCECGATDCAQPLEISPGTYSEVRSHPARFVIAPGHEIPEAEQVIERSAQYLLVEKIGEARVEAIAQAERLGGV